MVRMYRGWLTGVLLLVLCVAGARAETDFGRGLFWQVTSPKGQTNWLVGSIHVGDPKVESRMVIAEKLVPRAQRLVLELDRKELARASAGMAEHGDPPFSEVMPAEMAARVRAALLGRGLQATQIDNMPRWLVLIMLSMPQRLEPGMELRLMKVAASARKPVIGLETAREQLDIYRKMPPEVQDAILSWQVTHLDRLNGLLDRLFDLYAAEDLGRLLEFTFETSAPETLSAAQQADILDSMIIRRNLTMAERMDPYLQQGKSLVAIGALHLPGVLRELEGMGYTLKRLEF